MKQKMNRISFDFDKNFISAREPLENISQDELQIMVEAANGDEELACLFAGVFNQGEYLLYLEEWECKTKEEALAIRERYYRNRETELVLLEKILNRMGISNPKPSEPPIGYYYTVTPFMEQNGFIAESRVFIKKK